MFRLEGDAWIKHLKSLCDTRFGQCEPPTEDKIIQVNRTEEHPKPIFINESLSPPEKEDLIQLICEYIDVFAWSYKDMPGLDPQVVMHSLNINLAAKLFKQHQ